MPGRSYVELEPGRDEVVEVTRGPGVNGQPIHAANVRVVVSDRPTFDFRVRRTNEKLENKDTLTVIEELRKDDPKNTANDFLMKNELVIVNESTRQELTDIGKKGGRNFPALFLLGQCEAMIPDGDDRHDERIALRDWAVGNEESSSFAQGLLQNKELRGLIESYQESPQIVEKVPA